MAEPSIESMLSYLGVNLDENARRVLNLLKVKKVGENEIAEQLGVKINAVRKALYALSNKAYVSYSKKKSEEKKWWYIYFWQLDKKKIRQDFIRKKIGDLKWKHESLEKEQEFAFRCPNDCIKARYDEALENGFVCPECQSELVEISRSKKVAELKREIEFLENELGKLNAA